MDRQLPGSAVHHHLCVGWAELMTSLSLGRTVANLPNFWKEKPKKTTHDTLFHFFGYTSEL